MLLRWLPFALLCLSASAFAQAQPAPEPVGPHPKRQPIHFSVAPRSDSETLTLYVEAGINSTLGPGGTVSTGDFVPLCRAPCDFDLRSGTHVFGVADAARPVVRLDRELAVKRGQGVVVDYHSRLPLRIGGWILLLGSVGAASAMIAVGGSSDGGAKVGFLVGGSVLAALGIVGGLWMANVPDRATGWVGAAPPPAR